MAIQWQQTFSTNTLQEADIATLEQAIHTHPYFAAAKVLHFAARQKNNATADLKISNLQKAKNYSGNFYIFHKNWNALNIEKPIEKLVVADKEAIIDSIATPAFVDNYFDAQRIKTTEEDVSSFVNLQKKEKEAIVTTLPEMTDENALMITMSFTEWLAYFKKKKEQELQEQASKQAIKAMWQREKLTAAMEKDEDEDVVPENVFKMAIDSMNLNEGTASESLADILAKQGKIEKAIEMYRKLSLLNTEKSGYFAGKIKDLQKNN